MTSASSARRSQMNLPSRREIRLLAATMLNRIRTGSTLRRSPCQFLETFPHSGQICIEQARLLLLRRAIQPKEI